MKLHKGAHNIEGQVFGMLTVGKPTEQREHTKVLWHVMCACGRALLATVGELRGGKKSCGCANKRPDEAWPKNITSITINDKTLVERIVKLATQSGTKPAKWVEMALADWILEHRSNQYRGDPSRYDERADDTTAEYFV